MDDLMPKVEEDIFLEKTQEEDTLMEKPQEKGQVGSICDDQMLLILRTRCSCFIYMNVFPLMLTEIYV